LYFSAYKLIVGGYFYCLASWRNWKNSLLSERPFSAIKSGQTS